MKYKSFTFVAGFLLASAAAVGWSANDPLEGFKARLDKKEAGIAEPVRLIIQGRIPRDATAKVPENIAGLKVLQVKDHGVKIRRSLMGPRSLEAWYTLVGYEPGTYDIPAIEVTITPKGSAVEISKTPTITLTIKSLISGDVQKLDVKDIKGTYIPFPWKMFAFACFIAVSLLGWYLYVRVTTKPQSPAAVSPALPAHQIALERIKKLVDKDLVGRGLVEEFYVELSLIVRQYLEQRFAVRAPEMTTDEFLIYLRDSDQLSSPHKDLLRNFLSHCDMVKFARYTPVSDEAYGSLSSAKKLIEETKAS